MLAPSLYDTSDDSGAKPRHTLDLLLRGGIEFEWDGIDHRKDRDNAPQYQHLPRLITLCEAMGTQKVGGEQNVGSAAPASDEPLQL